MYGASGGQYVGNENAKAKNKIKSSVITTQHSSNYLLNGGFDGGSGIPYWTTSESVSLAYTNEPVGAKALSLKLTDSVSQSTAYQYVDLSKGDYTLSADFSTSSFPSGVTVYLIAESRVNSAHSVSKRIPVNRYFASDGIYTEALQFSAVPSVSGGTERFKISIVLSGSVSSDTALTVDNVMLSKTRGSAEYDLVSSGHFEANYGISPTSLWSLPYESGNIVTADSGNPLFGKVLKVDYAPEQFPVVTQTVYQAPQSLRDDFDGEVYTENKPVMFTVSGWAKGTGQSYSDEAYFCIDLNIQYYTGSGHYSSRTETVEFDRGITDWQFASDGFMSSYSDRMIDSVTILIYYIGHGGIGYFDDISVTIDTSTTTVNTYNNSGYLTKSRNGKGALSLTYNSNNDVVRSVNIGSRTVVDYEYYTNGSIWKKTQSKYTGNAPSSNNLLGICRTTYNYNTCGLVTEVLYEDLENSSLQTHTTVAYYTSEAPHIYGTVKSETDVLGNVTRYFHDAQTGKLSAVIYPNGKGTTYTYDGMGRITSILPATFSGSSYSQITTGARTQYGYDSAGRLSSITTRTGTTATTTYGFTYDVFGKGTGVSVGNRQIASYEYNTQNGKLNKLVYGNGLNVKYVYDEYERISEIEYRNGNSGSFTTAFKYTYDADGNLYSIEDVENHEITVNDFDASGSLRSSVTYNSSNYCNKYRGHYYYDDESRISEMYDSFDCKVGSGYYQAGNCYWFEYTDTGNLEELEIYDVNYSAKIDPQYDNLGRANTRSITAGTSGTAHHFYNSISFSYALSGTYSTGRVSQLNSVIKTSPNSPAVSDQTYNYTYDQNGNITRISGASGQTLYRYEYDALGQLTREDNLPLGKSYTYTYDLNGNRTSKTTYAFTTGSLGTAQSTVSYAYGDSGWKDLLTSFGNTSVSYDNCGNPTSIGYYSLTWKGRQLKTRYDGEYETLTFGYNADGVRVYKEEYEEEPGYTVRHEYTLSGSRIVNETVFYDGSEIFTLIYTYDENGSPIGYRFRRPNYAANVYDYYYFDKNLQGDIVAVYGSDGDLLVDYKYDAWGKCFAEYSDEYDDEYWDAPGEYFNPFRYRGYYYDEETGWYYLQSRYYNPEWGRFINVDSTDTLTASETSLTDKNLFAYCDNNPVNRSDDGGDFWHILAGAAIGAIGGAISSIVSQAISGEDINWKAVGISAASGAISGAITAACPCMGPIATGLVQGSLSAATYAATEKIAYGRDPTVKDTLRVGITSGVMAGGMKFLAQEAGLVQCFIAGTLVAAKSGLLPIEDIQPGDLVWATDPDTGETTLKTVVRTFINESEELVHLTVNGEEITTTPGHPFWVPQKGWTKAVHLRAGDRLQLLNGEYVVVDQVQHELLESPVFVYNFEVEDFHTYYVGTDSVLVHNKCGGSASTDLGRQGEASSGIVKNTKKIMMNGRSRIPDGFDQNMWVQEVKNVKNLSYTSQLRDYFGFANSNGLKMELYIRPSTNLSGPLQSAIKEMGVIIRYIH